MTRLLFIGGTPRGRRVLETLIEREVDLIGVYAMREDDHEQFRESDTISKLARDNSVPVMVTKRLSQYEEAEIVALDPELIIVVGWRTMISCAVYSLPRNGCVGVHDSPLPRYRGFAPVNWAIINGEPAWGVSLMHLAEGIDEGDIVAQKSFAIGERVTAAELYEQVTESTLEVINENLGALLNGSARRTPQDHARATYACARTPGDGEIDWSASTQEIDRLVRGLGFPYPGAFTSWKGEKITIWEAVPVMRAPVYEGRIAGRVVSFNDESADVLTGDGVLRITKVQLARGEVSDAGRILRTVKASLGD